MARFLGLDELFEGRHFDREIIVLCVRWYLRFKLSFRDLVEMMAERGLSLVHTTRHCHSNRVWQACRSQARLAA
jgi:transposase-like protein